jgi:putative sigma-54 modulation protein
MQISVTFRHLDSSDALRRHAEDKLAHLTKYLDPAAEAHVVLSHGKHSHKADVQISSHGMFMRGKEESGDMYNSIERAVEKLEKQVKRYKDKLVGHKPREGAKLKVKFNTIAEHEPVETAPAIPKEILETKEVFARPMGVDEAVMQMDLLGSEILVFLNSKTEHLNIIYRKKGRGYGLIETL